MAAIDGIIMFTRSDCYITAQKMTPKGIVVHSTGADNPDLKRYVQPDDGNLGNNPNNNDYNRPGLDVCVHAYIGKDKNGNIKCYQTLPFDICCWGVASGSKGSYNYDPAYIQFEMCEDSLNDKGYCVGCYNKAAELCVYLCRTYNISPENIVSHHEAGQLGYGSQHTDPDNWWKNFNITMDDLRNDVKKELAAKTYLDKSGYKKGDATIGSLALKELLLIAKKLKINEKGMDENRPVGDGTVNAINYLLGKWGYAQNGIAGENFIKRLRMEIDKKI